MAEIGKYIFGIMNSNTNLQLTMPKALLLEEGESPMAVYTIPHEDVSALVRDASGVGSPPKSKETLARLLIGHQAVIERIMAGGATVIPMKLGTYAQDENEVKAILNEGYPLMKEILERIADKIEIDVVATWSHFASTVKDAGEEKEIKEFKERLLSQPRGVTVDDQMKIGLMIKKALDEKRAGVFREILERLQAVSEDARIHELMDDQMVMNAAFLITRAKHKDFEEKVEELNATMQEKLNFRCVGPLPPYSYYTLEVRKFVFEEIDWARKKLGLLNERATRGEIKNAHKAMAFSFHPDRNPNVPGIEKEFDEITQAYNVLWEYCRKDFCSFEEAEFAKNAVLIKVLGSPS
ncbi:MAG: GvpL/GvpF family gas vesicle protein [Candidatus Aminicenantales bacterium]